MMKRRIALVFLFFAAFMLAAHAVLPHHHHCHEVIFLKACDLTGSHEEEDTEFLIQQENAEHDCYPVPDSDSDPCWQNNQYLSEEHEEASFSTPADCFLPLFLAFTPVYPDFSILTASIQKFFISRHEKPCQDLFPAGIFGLRAPPVG